MEEARVDIVSFNDLREDMMLISQDEEMERQLELELARNDFWLYCLVMDKKFFESRELALKPFCDTITRLYYDDNLKHIGASMPPRMGKSYVTNLASSWWLGKEMYKSVMRVSYSESLANELSDSVRTIVRDNEKYKEIFPNVELRKDKQAIDNWKLTTSKQQGYCCAGVGGSLTGKGASGLCITDDLFKGFAEASSPTLCSATWTFYQGTLDARMEPGCKTIDVGTRWTESDVLGKLISIGYFDEYIIIPALDENGESTCPGFRTTEEWLEKKAKIDDYIWEAEYQQNPIPPQGLLYSRGFKTYEPGTIPDGGFGITKAYCDPANQGNDFLCLVVYKQVENPDTGAREAYILDVLYTQADMTETLNTVPNKLVKNNVSECTIEINKESLFLSNIREKLHKAEWFKTSLKPNYSTTNKLIRIQENSAWVQENMYFPRDWSTKFPLFYKHVTRHSRVGKNAHDDAVEVLSEIAIEVSGQENCVILF